MTESSYFYILPEKNERFSITVSYGKDYLTKDKVHVADVKTFIQKYLPTA